MSTTKEWDDHIPMTDITGRDGFIITRALLWAIAAIDHQPEHIQAPADRDDMVRLLRGRYRTPAGWHGIERQAFNLAADTGWPCRLKLTDDPQ
jgi:hypothetical protein